MQPQEAPEQTYEVFSKWMDIRRADLNAVMDDYISKEGKADFVMMGHSLGGSVAYCMARVREDVSDALLSNLPACMI